MQINSKKSNFSSISSSFISKEDQVKIEQLKEFFIEKYDVNLIDILKRQKRDTPEIPVSIFDNDFLSCFEAIVRYLRDNLHLTNKDISKLTDRKENTISTTYNNSLKKYSGKLSEGGHYFIPLSQIKNRTFSVLENICMHLKIEYYLRNKQIAKLLKRDNRTIWTVISRANKKIKK